ncbi:hypothetical protein CHS0354_014768 [Potamilus streckersoni]|uniref:UBZ4-type domain-containing protein n=1 Tax=Potamilus streckersoni TaxID=2493646 RepID=A0AAE0VQD7_9BIVA|nr:hypothetical protein CHS0354_014768 [Potamilus streckersoni]
MDSAYSQCPICNKEFVTSLITIHVNRCLNAAESDKPSLESPNSPENRKRKSDQAWGSLKPSSILQPKPNDSNKKIKNDFDVLSSPRTNFSKCSTNEGNKSIIQINDDPDTPLVCDLSSGASIIKLNFKQNKNHTHSPVVQNSSRDIHSTLKRVEIPVMNFAKVGKVHGKPLAEQVRPKTLADYVGQENAVGRNSMLRTLLKNLDIPSMILWGPPGCGKTTLARIIAHNCNNQQNWKFVQLSATSAGVNDVKEVIRTAKTDQKMFKKRTILFIDEIHRFNKSQQDTLLPHVEDGTVVLIGATTENPSFQVNSALLSRCRVIVLEKLESEQIEKILLKALPELDAEVFDVNIPPSLESERPRVWIETQALKTLSHLCDGDARIALNGLQMAVQSQITKSQSDERKELTAGSVVVKTEHIKEGLQKSHILYDKTGEEHYNIISALHKSMRGSDASAALYWLARMLEGGETPLYVARRLVRFASEDVGIADPLALNQAVAAYQACHFLGMPECDVILAQCVVYLARAPKSIEVYQAYKKASACVRNHKGPLPGVPLHLRNAPTKLMKDIGYGKNYKYNPSFSEPVEQDYFPECLLGTDFFK